MIVHAAIYRYNAINEQVCIMPRRILSISKLRSLPYRRASSQFEFELEERARNYTIRILQLPIETTRRAPISYKSRVTQFD